MVRVVPSLRGSAPSLAIPYNFGHWRISAAAIRLTHCIVGSFRSGRHNPFVLLSRIRRKGQDQIQPASNAAPHLIGATLYETCSSRYARAQGLGTRILIFSDKIPTSQAGPGTGTRPAHRRHASASCHARSNEQILQFATKESYLLDVESGGGAGEKGSNGELHLDLVFSLGY